MHEGCWFSVQCDEMCSRWQFCICEGFFFLRYFIHLKNFIAPLTYHTAEDALAISCCVNDNDNKVYKVSI